MKKQLSLIIKMSIMLALAVVGIMYIMDKSPRSEVRNYQKQSMPKPSYSRSSGGFFSDLSSSARGETTRGNGNGNDDVSLTGKSGRYDEVRIGGSTDK